MTNLRTFDSTADAVAFPLGGIGTGNISLGARGDLRDWEIANQPAKGNKPPNTFFMLRTQTAGQEPVMRILEGPIPPPYTKSHGYGPDSTYGLPRVKGTTMRGEYPFATIDFDAPMFPVSIQLEAFTPLIPLNPEDSGIPCAIFTFTLANTTDQPVDLTLVGSLGNMVGDLQFDAFGNPRSRDAGRRINEFWQDDALRGVVFRAENIAPDSLHFGNLVLATDHDPVTHKPAWLRGAWWDYLQDFWDDLAADGVLDDLGYATPTEGIDTGSLGVIDTLAPGATQTYRFVLAWYFPNRINNWDPPNSGEPLTVTRNHYATLFASAWDVAQYVFDNLPRLEGDTRRFRDALFDSTLPPVVIDAISANIVPVRSNTCFWLEDGRFFGWEGCFDARGCCPGSCTHVWSYAQTVAFLFPSLEREMRRIEFAVETDDEGYMAFRAFRTFQPDFEWQWQGTRSPIAVDGQCGSIVRAYREWRLSGDRDWLAGIWPGVKRAIDYLSATLDPDGDGVLDGKQHNTYDIEFYGPNPLSSVYYLAALRAVEELARIMDESEIADRCRAAFEKGSAKLDALLWNGDYYAQKLADVDAYKYQHGTGCLTDQLLGQLHAHVTGLGYLLPVEHVRAALAAIFKHNFRTDFTDHVNCQRTFALYDDAGLLLCSWPQGGRPRLPFVYSDEVWTGVEYHVAAHMIYEGLIDEALAMVQAVRDRHDGYKRNPWNEVECGHHYARSMSSWALLTAFSGIQCDLGAGTLAFDPVLNGVSYAGPDAGVFRCFWAAGTAWGTYQQTRDPATGAWQPAITVLGGDLGDVKVTACGQRVIPMSDQTVY